MKIHGRGGTEFISSYNWIEEHFDSEPVAIIHATDGWGKFPRFCRDPVVFLIPKEVEERSDLRQFPEWAEKSFSDDARPVQGQAHGAQLSRVALHARTP